MSEFNKSSRKLNALKSSSMGIIGNFINSIFAFVYRSVFIRLLSVQYLGLNGLFSNILQMLSLAELGISSAITVQLYKPISDSNIELVGKLMNFYKKMYRLIAMTVLFIGLLILPFLNIMILDTSEIPHDVNMYLIYILFLLEKVASYICTYRTTLLIADQKLYAFSFFDMVLNSFLNLARMLTLFITRNYTITLIVSIASTISLNICFSLWIKNKYRAVFSIKSEIDENQKREIYNYTAKSFVHKISSFVLRSTDSIVLSKYCGLLMTGIYSNYMIVISLLNSVVIQIFGGFYSSIGNAKVELNENDKFEIFKRLRFANFWFVGMITCCLYILIDDFMNIWLGEGLTFSSAVTLVICIEFYLDNTRSILNSYTLASGLNNKDGLRAVIEAVLNIFISIYLTKRIGAIGVFLGTVISCLLTVFWRMPLILYKYEFKKSTKDYWQSYIIFTFMLFVSIVVSKKVYELIKMLKALIIIKWIIGGVLCVLIYNIFAVLLFNKTDEFKYYYILIKQALKQ